MELGRQMSEITRLGTMARSGAFYTFITQDELLARLDKIRQQARVHLMIEHFLPVASIKVVSPDEIFVPDTFPHRIYLSATPPLAQGQDGRSLGEYAFNEGWSYVTFWGCEDGVLYQTDLGFKSSRAGAPTLFQTVKKALRIGLTRGVLIRGTLGGPERLLKDRYYSSGAKDCYESGIVWRQYGVPNSWFSPAPAKHRPSSDTKFHS